MTVDPSKWIFCNECQALHPANKHQPRSKNPFGGPGAFSFDKPSVPPREPEPRTVDDLLQGWRVAGARPEVELPAERRAHIGRWAAELKEWKANGLNPNEALSLVAMEMQLEFRRKNQEGGS